MKSNGFLRLILFGSTEKRIITRKKLMTTYVSLFLVFTLCLTGTLAWFTSKNMSSLGSDLLTMSSSTGLSINEGESITNKIIINNFELSEASSVDGRNMFFPITGSMTGTIGNQTANMLFREGNAGDKNILYAYKNLTIVGVTDPTNIYVKSYKVVLKDKDGKVLETFDGTTQILDTYKTLYDSNGNIIGKDTTQTDGIFDKQVQHEKCPIRIAFIDDSQNTPKVFDPTVIIQEHVNDYYAINYISAEGSATTKRTNNEAFSKYIFSDKGTPLFQISHSDSIDLAMVIWLEGTGENLDRYSDGHVSVEVELESNFSNMVPIKFVDKTSNDDNKDKNSVDHWVEGSGDDKCIVTMAYKDTDGATKTVVMSKIEGADPPTWTAMIPAEITTEISFYRLALKNETIFNAWHTTENSDMRKLNTTSKDWLTRVFGMSDLETSRILSNGSRSLTYTARCGNGYSYVKEDDAYKDMKRLSPCIGFWDSATADKGLGSSGGNEGTGGGGEVEGGTAKVAVNVNVPENKMNEWIGQNLNNGYKPYVELDDGTLYPMTIDSGDIKRWTLAQTEMTVGKRIMYITLKSQHDTKRDLKLSIPQVISTNYIYNYKIDNSNHVVPN